MQDVIDQVVALRPFLVKVAHQRLRNKTWAEDVVSETIIAALERPEAFAGRSSLRTWLVGILKHKVIDQIRRHAREIPSEMSEGEVEPEFEGSVRLGNTPDLGTTLGNPQDALSARQFFSKLEASLTLLPARQAQAFMLRNWMEEDTSDICNILGVTPSNLGVLLHRARTGLRVAFQER